jgi:hypothetical protein
MSGGAPPAPLGGTEPKPFPWGWVALGGLAVGAGALLLYSGEIGAGLALAANPPRKRKSNDEYSPFPRELLPGGRAAGMRPSDFDSVELARGTGRLEHTDDCAAREIAMDHLEDNITKLDAMSAARSGNPIGPTIATPVRRRLCWSNAPARTTTRTRQVFTGPSRSCSRAPTAGQASRRQ